MLAVVGCASQPEYAPFAGIPRGAAIYVEPFGGVTETGPPASKIGERAFEGGGMGAAAGAQTGWDLGSDMTGDCGEFFPVCLALMPVFGVAGLIGGVIVGGTVGLIEDLPYKDQEAVQRVISGYFEAAPPNQTFRERFIETASGDWQIDRSARTRVMVAVIGVRPKAAQGDTLGFEVTTAMTVDYGRGSPATTKPYQFTAATTAYEIDEWIDGGHELYGSEVEQAFDKAAGVFAALLKHPPRH